MIQVTQEQIDTKCHGSQNCPVAQAVKEHYGADYASVGFSIGYHKENRWHWFACPPNVASFITRYDGGLPVEPFTFDLEDRL